MPRPPNEMPPAARPRSDEEWGRSSVVRSRRRRARRRKRRLLIAAVIVVIVAAVVVRETSKTSDGYALPSASTLSGMSLRQRIVAIADSQLGYSSQPSNSYCNKYSAYWDAGTSNCPSGELSEEWCADFAAWAWRLAGVHFVYGYDHDDINGAVVSFYQWAVAHGLWHPLSSGYVAAPGDVAIYGLSHGADPSAVHAAIVTSDSRGANGPDVVNGDGDRTGFSVVETGTNQEVAQSDGHGARLDGYVSPT